MEKHFRLRTANMPTVFLGLEKRADNIWDRVAEDPEMDNILSADMFDAGAARKRILTILHNYERDDRKLHSEQLERYRTGEKIPMVDHVMSNYVAPPFLGAGTGAIAGTALSIPLHLAKIFKKKWKGIPFTRISAATLGGLGLLGGIGYGVTRKRPTETDPGKYKIDTDTKYNISEFSKPYIKGKPHLLNDWFEFELGRRGSDKIIYEK